MKTVKVVPINFVNSVWNRVEPFISNALEHCAGEYDAEHIRVYLTQGIQTLVIAVDEDDTIHGAATVEFINYPKQRIAFITAIGGKMISTKELWDQFEDWVRQMGATSIRGAARESISRLWRRAFKFEERYIIVEKKL